jgi:hypothetical protein
MRAVIHSITQFKEPYLQSNLLAILIDLAPNISNMNEYVAERLVTILCKLGNKYIAVKSILIDSELYNSQYSNLVTSDSSNGTLSSPFKLKNKASKVELFSMNIETSDNNNNNSNINNM